MKVLQQFDAYYAKNKGVAESAKIAENPMFKHYVSLLSIFDKIRPVIKVFDEAGFTVTSLSRTCYMSGELQIPYGVFYFSIIQGFDKSPYVSIDFSVQGTVIDDKFGCSEMDYSSMVENWSLITTDYILNIVNQLPDNSANKKEFEIKGFEASKVLVKVYA
jgi:hypothetical protein